MLDPYNAFVSKIPEAVGGSGPLSRMTVAIKANIAVQSQPFHAGIGSLANRIAREDAVVVKRLRAAGAAIVGTLHMEEAALGAKSDNPHFGPVHNPHRHGWSPGGSSGGSGAAVAAGLCDAALGTDTMGSVRIPAAHCGVYGFKPATARVSQHGLEPADLAFDAIGPLARDLDTLERVAWVISDMGPLVEDFGGAVLTGHGVQVHPEVAQVFDGALAALPHTPEQVSLPDPCGRIRYAGFIHVAKAMAMHLKGVSVSPRLEGLIAYGPARSVEGWAEDQAVLARTRTTVRAAVERHGFLILPTVPNLPFPHSEAEPAGQADFTCLANIAGLPALSLPTGWSADGMPSAVQIVAREGYEAGLFALARHLDAKLKAYRPPQGEA